MCVTINLSEKGRNRLGVVIAILNVVLFLTGVSLVLAGIFIQVHVNDELILLESYNSGLLPNFMVSVGSIVMLLNIISAKIAYDSGFDVTREKYRMTLLPLVVLMLLTTIVIMACGITCLTHRSSVEEALHDGLMDSMKRYKGNLAVKLTLDQTQMFSRCCGSRSYKNWFMVSWIDTDFVDTNNPNVRRKITNGDFYTDSVPFSCCDAKANIPCKPNHLHHANKHKLAIYKQGCTDILMDKMEQKILTPVGIYIMSLFGAQFLVTFLLRYLQTSIEDSYLEGDTEGPGKAYFCPNFLVTFLLRYLQTSIEDSYLEGDTEGPGKAYFCPNVCPSCLTTGDPNKYIKKGALSKDKQPLDDSLDSTEDNDETIVDMEGPPGLGANFGDMGGAFGAGGGGGGERDGGNEKKNKKGKDKTDKTKGKKDKSKNAKLKTKPSKPKSMKAKKSKSPKSPKSPKKSKFSKPKFKKPKFGKKK